MIIKRIASVFVFATFLFGGVALPIGPAADGWSLGLKVAEAKKKDKEKKEKKEKKGKKAKKDKKEKMEKECSKDDKACNDENENKKAGKKKAEEGKAKGKKKGKKKE